MESERVGEESQRYNMRHGRLEEVGGIGRADKQRVKNPEETDSKKTVGWGWEERDLQIRGGRPWDRDKD